VTCTHTMRLAILLALVDAAASEHNYNHIFNAIHSSMRQWGSSESSVHPNGMSFFIASVPRDTQSYHGTSTELPVKGMDWLAFEPEHALGFAHLPRLRRAPAPVAAPQDGPSTPSQSMHRDLLLPLGPASFKPDDSNLGGYLHTYRTGKPPSLLYIDGMAAAECEKGTLDSTDTVLLGVGVGGIKGWDWERGVSLCNLTQNEWGGRIDGFLRMEGGLEIILCDFAKHLVVDRIARTVAAPGNTPDPFDDGSMPYYRAVASRFDGIGGNRVAVNYEEFVTAFAYDVDLFHGNALPRLSDISNKTTGRIHRDVTRLVTSHPSTILATTNWQAITDMVVDRYSSRLESLVAASSLDLLQADAETLLAPYIDCSRRNRTAEAARCAEQYLPVSSSKSLPLAAKAIRSVSAKICGALLETRDATTPDFARSSLENLMAYLQWTGWKRCHNCEVDEVCYIPMWPFGRTQDYEKPQYRSSIPNEGPGESYWD
ncbi:hypothetical protein AURDEDRAFT_75297, partial [Auricularia subglabra TFB-10046 SS5]